MQQFPDDWLYFIGKEEVDFHLKKIGFSYDIERSNHTIYPPSDQTFRALTLTPVDSVKVVILGQDPYHGEGQANGLAFSVADGCVFPPSLRNIFQEVFNDVGTPIPKSGELDRWAKQGVLLINSSMSVRSGEAGSHSDIGWQDLTQSILSTLSKKRQNIVYILWGNHAKRVGRCINRSQNFIIESAHPSPLSSYRGFFGSRPFSKTNDYLKSVGQNAIEW